MRHLILVLLFLASSSSLFAQYELRKTADGVSLESQLKGRRYIVNIPAKTVVPYGVQQASHPHLMVDGVYLQMLSVPLAEFKGDAAASDEAVLRQQMQYEANFQKVPLSSIRARTRKLPKGRVALVWSFKPAAAPTRQVFLTIRAGNYVVVLGSAVQPSQSEPQIERFLARIADSFRPVR